MPLPPSPSPREPQPLYPCLTAAAALQVHYGRASLTPVSTCPAFFVFPKALQSPSSAEAAAALLVAAVAASPALSGKKALLVIVDQAYQHALGELRGAVQRALQVIRVVGAELPLTRQY